jgi:hypothetical protein
MDQEAEIARGQQAQQLLENPLLVEALEAVEARYSDAWLNSTLSQAVLREEAYRMLAAVKELRTHLTRFAETGKLAAIARDTKRETDIKERKLRAWDGSPDGHTGSGDTQ